MAQCDLCRKEAPQAPLCKIQAECTPEKKSYSYWVCSKCLGKVINYIEKDGGAAA